MKIGGETNPLRRKELSGLDGRQASLPQSKGFGDLLSQQDEQQSKQQLEQWMVQIHRQGERLSRSMTLRELRLYRSLIKSFLESTAKKGIELKETRGWDRRGRGRLYQIIEEVDQKLIEMADDLLKQEEGRVKILRNIGEIKGLLLNLYF